MIINGNPVKQLIKQLNSFYTINRKEKKILKTVNPVVITRLNDLFLNINNKYYCKQEGFIVECYFNSLHVSQYTMYLYIISNIIFKEYKEHRDLCDKIYGLLKIISSMDLFYEIDLPQIFFFDHPQGSVIGRAVIGNYFSFSQGCTIGNNKGKYPKIGEHVSLFSNSKIIGDCNIGDYVIISANTYIKDVNIPSNSIVFGQSPNLTIKPITFDKYYEITNPIFKKEGKIK